MELSKVSSTKKILWLDLKGNSTPEARLCYILRHIETYLPTKFERSHVNGLSKI